MKKSKRLKALLMAGIMSVMLVGCGKLYEGSKSGFVQATSVQGVTFDMPEGILESATAITSISEDEDYSTATYLYKNGTNRYILFNINQVVVLVEQGTTFNVKNASSKKEALLSDDINGAWIQNNDGKLKYEDTTKDGVYKIIADASADLSITSELYGEFNGKVAIIQTDNYECAMFVGISSLQSDVAKSDKETVEHIVKSLTYDKNYSSTEGADDTEKEENEKVTETEKVKETEINSEEKETEIIISEETETDEVEIVIEEPETESATETEAETETEEVKEPETENEEETKDNESKDSLSSVGSNQSKPVGGKSDIYHMLSLTESGICSSLTEDGKGIGEEIVTIEELYTGEEAKKIIQDYCKSSMCAYTYEDAPLGYSWHVIKYSRTAPPDSLYLDIRLRGLDGENLKFRGVKASQRTHDILSNVKKTNVGYENLYCYYAVPNGCKEYALECGDKELGAAYYHITLK